MTKDFCDICEKEIPKSDFMVSAFTSVKYVSRGKGMEPMKHDELFCSDCTPKVKERVGEMRKTKTS